MKILVTGGSGFVGRHLVRTLLESGHHVTAVGTRPAMEMPSPSQFTYISADTTKEGAWQDAVSESHAVINLTGKSIFGRWNRRFKRRVRESRLLTTTHIVDALPENNNGILISASAVGYYGHREDEVLTEASSPGDDFLARLSVEWEDAALRARQKGVRVAIARISVVLGANEGALAQMVPAFKKFLGGPIGSGRQWFSWIHVDDLVSALMFMIDQTEIQGPVNCCAPEPLRNKAFVKALASILGRPAMVPAPPLMLRMVLGEFAETLLASQRMMPEKLLQNGFQFRYPNAVSALEHLLEK